MKFFNKELKKVYLKLSCFLCFFFFFFFFSLLISHEILRKVKNIPVLLDTDDMVMMKKPEPRSVQTYIQWIWSVYGPTSGYGPTPQEVQK